MIQKDYEYQLREKSRVYVFAGDTTLEIDEPRTLRVSDSHNHYVTDEAGNKFIVSPQWLFITINSDHDWIDGNGQK